MIRNLKALGLALVAVLAMSAVVASTASAEFEAESTPVTLTTGSSQMQKFAPTAGGTAVECTTITLSNSTQAVSPNTTVTVSPSYSNCETFLGQVTTVNNTGCDFVFHLAANSTTGTTDIVCPNTTDIIFPGPKFVTTHSTIEITVGNICKYTIASQNGLGSINYVNFGFGSTREFAVVPNITGITSTRTTNHFFCPAGGSFGTYTGSMTVTGENAEGAHVGVFVD